MSFACPLKIILVFESVYYSCCYRSSSLMALAVLLRYFFFVPASFEESGRWMAWQMKWHCLPLIIIIRFKHIYGY